MTTKLAGLGALECLCTDLRFGAAALRRTGQQMRVITNLPPVPAGTSRVDIVFPGLTTFTDVAVTPRARLDLPVGRARRTRSGFLDLSGGPATSGLGTAGLADAVAADGPAHGPSGQPWTRLSR